MLSREFGSKVSNSTDTDEIRVGGFVETVCVNCHFIKSAFFNNFKFFAYIYKH